jgi:hypothetical protein
MERVPQAVKKAGHRGEDTSDMGESHFFFFEKEVMDMINGNFSHNPLIYTMYYFTHYDYLYIYTLFMAMVYIIYILLFINVISSRYIMIILWY